MSLMYRFLWLYRRCTKGGCSHVTGDLTLVRDWTEHTAGTRVSHVAVRYVRRCE
jgi:hypothetical protein